MIKTPSWHEIKIFLKWGLFLLVYLPGLSPLFGQTGINAAKNEEISFDEKAVKEFKALLDSSSLYQKRARQVDDATAYLRKELALEKDSTKIKGLENDILSMESLYESYLLEADDYYKRAKGMGIPFSEISVPVSAQKVSDHRKNIIAGKVTVVPLGQPDSSKISTPVASLQESVIPSEPELDTVKPENEYFNEFNILGSEQEADRIPILLNQPLPPGIIYRIQIGIFKDLDSKQYFKGIEPVMAESVEDKDLIRYSVGLFSRFSDANEALGKVKEKGFTDAFIVAFYNQVRIQVKYARTLEEENKNEDSSY